MTEWSAQWPTKIGTYLMRTRWTNLLGTGAPYDSVNYIVINVALGFDGVGVRYDDPERGGFDQRDHVATGWRSAVTAHFMWLDNS